MWAKFTTWEKFYFMLIKTQNVVVMVMKVSCPILLLGSWVS